MKTTIKSFSFSFGLVLLFATSGCQTKREPYVVSLPAPREIAPTGFARNDNPTPALRQSSPPPTRVNTPPDSIIDAEPLIPKLGDKVEETDMSNKALSQQDKTTSGIILKAEGKPGLPPRVTFEHFFLDDGALKSDTVYFEFDRADIRSGEVVKIEEVALFLRAKTANAVLIDGHCDRRGTEEYNRALGERRALSIREQLIMLGVEPDRIYTRSFGEDLPADDHEAEGAHAKNRRGEFALLVPRN